MSRGAEHTTHHLIDQRLAQQSNQQGSQDHSLLLSTIQSLLNSTGYTPQQQSDITQQSREQAQTDASTAQQNQIAFANQAYKVQQFRGRPSLCPEDLCRCRRVWLSADRLAQRAAARVDLLVARESRRARRPRLQRRFALRLALTESGGKPPHSQRSLERSCGVREPAGRQAGLLRFAFLPLTNDPNSSNWPAPGDSSFQDCVSICEAVAAGRMRTSPAERPRTMTFRSSRRNGPQTEATSSR